MFSCPEFYTQLDDLLRVEMFFFQICHVSKILPPCAFCQEAQKNRRAKPRRSENWDTARIDLGKNSSQELDSNDCSVTYQLVKSPKLAEFQFLNFKNGEITPISQSYSKG